MRVEWGKAPDFAEVAETLGVPTDHIMGAMPPEDGTIYVMFTPSLEGKNPPVYRAILKRDADGILVKFGEPEVIEDFYERLRQIMGDKLADKFGEPG